MAGSPPRLLIAEPPPSVDAIIVMDHDGRIVEWSPNAETLFGWKRSEALGRLAASLFIPDQFREVFWSNLQELCSHDPDSKSEFNQIEVTGAHRDGSEFLINLSATCLNLEEQTLYLSLVRNLTASREREQTTAKQVMESRLIQQTTALSSIDDTFEDAMGKAMESICAMTGWPVGFALAPDSEHRILTSTNIFHIDPDERLAGFDPGPFQIPIDGFLAKVWEQNEPLWIAGRKEIYGILPKRFQEMDCPGAFCFAVDVDEEIVAVLLFFSWEETEPASDLLLIINNFREQIGLAIERRRWIEERARLAAIVESSYDAIIAKDIAGRIIAWNSGAEQVYGYSSDEVLGKSIEILFPENLKEDESQIRNILRTGQRLKILETKRRRKDGTIVDVALTASPIRDSRGRVVGISTIQRDITVQKRREQELRKAKRDAEKADRAKSEFLANISHELRTPMNAILGMLNLSLNEEISDVMRDYLSTAHESAQTLLYLLNDLLDFSRMSAGHLELEQEPFRLRETLDSAMKTLSLKASEKGLELACHVASEVPNYLQGDGMRLRQIIVNLAGNSIKFTEQGEVVAQVSLLSRKDGEAVLQFAVRDTGIGISSEDQHKIFAPFTQVDASTTRSETGSGLGLAIVRELVGKMGGSIGVESEVGQGSLFYFSVPFVVLSQESPQNEGLELANLPVLVVDDNRTNQLILEETLANWSMRPTVVGSAKEALALLQQADERGETFPVVIVDALMPDMDGFMLVEFLNERQEADSKPVTVLMLSSADRQTFKQRCRNLEVSAYLEKPVSQSELLDTLMTVLKGPLLDQDSYDQLKPTRQRLRILVAEDTPANQKVIRAILQKRGHQVEIANNGREALDQVRQEAFDLVLMDVQMPTMDGLQATRAIRLSPHQDVAEVPIVAMTAHARREDRQKCLAAGMDAYIAKPIDAQKLVQLVESVKHRTNLMRASETWQGGTSSSELEKPPEHINLESAKARMSGDEDLVIDLAQFFIEDAPQLLAEIEQALQKNDEQTIERAAHTLKGLAANFDAETLATAAMAMEDRGRNGQLKKARELFPDLRRSLRVVVKELQRYLKRHGKIE